MQQLVQLIEKHGEECTDDWHGVVYTDTTRTCCGRAVDPCGDFDWKDKIVKRGGITCESCIDAIKQYKSIKF